MLSNEELAFLHSQGLSPEDVFDTHGQSPARCADAARAAGKCILYGAPCQKSGHRLRTRTGHCVQCDPAKIAFASRHRKRGEVYLAVSTASGQVKIGVSTQAKVREAHTNRDSYGASSDWKIILKIEVDEAGRLESETHTALGEFRNPTPYMKDGKSQMAMECFLCRPIEAASTLVDRAASGGFKVFGTWRDEAYGW